ncbi:nitrate- and nitrite sensing domain-containing protein [Saccharopolyspora sp. K220]|uniref:sensor histidine kinase n=1 Tax=Saccharopolyspora soli TaxID=2926618 RepID=UPI001F5A044D|nr:nitrate- and nitrite sensing domain-containing protein [Saccharopolyspora soli]MCI2419951.1 nitrate- and nitrite sensing domain-containing protein [Saccharopolyspora soli]
MARTSSSGSEYKTIRARLTRVGVVPSIILLTIWLGYSSLTVYDGYYSRVVATGVKNASIPAVNSLVALQNERRLAVERLSRPDVDPAALTSQRTQTDKAVGEMRANLRNLVADAPQPIAVRVRDLEALLAQLPQMRARLDRGQASRPETFDYYNRLLDAGVNLFDTQARVVPDLQSSHAGLVATEVFRAADQMSRAASLGSAALVSGEFSTEDHLAFVYLVGAYHAKLDTDMPAAQPRAVELHRQLTSSVDWRRLIEFENALVEHPPQRNGNFAVNEADWRQVTHEVSEDLVAVAVEQANAGAELGMQNGNSQFIQVLLGSLATLVAVLAGIVLASRNARRLVDRTLVNRLAKLRDDTLQLASERLPAVMSHLKRGEPVDVEAELAPLDYGTDEIGQVADAFNTAHHTAVVAAVQENQAKEGANKVFLGIAHRNQGLVHRQLKVLDKMERSEEHPERLDGLFQLDHLATRARRNAENLIILAGEQPGRQWRKPVRLVDIVRSAVAETEHYYRIRVHPTPDVSLVGAAVGDVIHLLAELMDNATSYSSPRSQVQVYSSDTPRGVLLQIEDEGLGMRPADRDDANVLLSTPPKFEDITLRGDSRLGLFVVARLAARRRIEVDLRDAAEGGTVAFVLLPNDIVANESRFEPRLARSRQPERDLTPPPAHDLTVQRPVPTTEPPQFPSTDPDQRPVLPRRERQQNLVPQLRAESSAGDSDIAGQAGHSPERTRGNMAAFQRGTREARWAEGGE